MSDGAEPAGSAEVSAAIAAACECSGRHGVVSLEPVVLHHGSNLLIHLRPHAVVARVPARVAEHRPGSAWLAREVAVASHLALRGAPSVGPSSRPPPGPHVEGGRWLAFAEHAASTGDPPDAAAAGAALYACHAALADYRGALPRLGLLVEARSLSERLRRDGRLDERAAAILGRAAHRAGAVLARDEGTLRPVHGDAHLQNALSTSRGVLWCDFEDACLAPPEWDLACLVASARVAGVDGERAERALAAYRRAARAHGAPEPDETRLDACIEARTVQSVVWSVVAEGDDPTSPARRARRLAWLHARA